ncbi:MAG: DUF4197 domain-containing protein [Mariprofundaceae bacterium]|nr:DUF4197 domain-containing protein [Mariprofundaceae bacterium]
MKLKFVLGLCSCLMVSTAHAGDWMSQLGNLSSQVQDLNKTIAVPQSINTALSSSDIVKGLKDALKVGSERVVTQLSQKNGFDSDAKIHIPLPDSLKRVKSLLTSVGAGSLMDDLELKLNRAAEAATPKAKRIFLQAIRSMSVQDARAILQGPNDAATSYFKGKMSGSLSNEMQPIIQQTLNQVGAIQAYNRVMGKYQSMPFVPNIQSNLQQHVTQGALRGIFHYMGTEEAAIRKNPAKRTTEILRKVFSKS